MRGRQSGASDSAGITLMREKHGGVTRTSQLNEPSKHALLFLTTGDLTQ